MWEEKKLGEEVKVAQWDDSSASFAIYFKIPERVLWWESRVGVKDDSCNSAYILKQ